MKVKDSMTKKVVTLRPEQELWDAMLVLKKKKISGAPVVEGKRVVGVLSESDILKHLAFKPELGHYIPAPFDVIEALVEASRERTDIREHIEFFRKKKVADVMNKRPEVVDEEALLTEACSVMVKGDINRLPVVGKTGELCGILTRADVVKAMAGR